MSPRPAACPASGWSRASWTAATCGSTTWRSRWPPSPPCSAWPSTAVPAEHLWVNPECGLKTRGWPGTRAALHSLVAAAHTLRAELTG
ncbi:hypothetical protein [Kitasatospora sp. NPDC048407]|uniref:hypothetical protein n=1 Tax=Kitasatospora sp. NPDC048407 TaxID=3364051 RepID=UPI0037224172